MNDYSVVQVYQMRLQSACPKIDRQGFFLSLDNQDDHLLTFLSK